MILLQLLLKKLSLFSPLQQFDSTILKHRLFFKFQTAGILDETLWKLFALFVQNRRHIAWLGLSISRARGAPLSASSCQPSLRSAFLQQSEAAQKSLSPLLLLNRGSRISRPVCLLNFIWLIQILAVGAIFMCCRVLGVFLPLNWFSQLSNYLDLTEMDPRSLEVV